MDKNKALSDWVSTYPNLYNWLYFNTIIILPDNVSLMTDSDNVIEEYIDGSSKRDYNFVINFMKNYDTGTSDINIEAMAESQNFNKWLKEQVRLKNFPQWGDNNVIDDIEVLSEVPLMSVDNDANVAKYMLQLKIIYLEKEIEDYE